MARGETVSDEPTEDKPDAEGGMYYCAHCTRGICWSPDRVCGGCRRKRQVERPTKADEVKR